VKGAIEDFLVRMAALHQSLTGLEQPGQEFAGQPWLGNLEVGKGIEQRVEVPLVQFDHTLATLGRELGTAERTGDTMDPVPGEQQLGSDESIDST
jgi:hypothetical protein